MCGEALRSRGHAAHRAKQLGVVPGAVLFRMVATQDLFRTSASTREVVELLQERKSMQGEELLCVRGLVPWSSRQCVGSDGRSSE